jgi:hypothetical protein
MEQSTPMQISAPMRCNRTQSKTEMLLMISIMELRAEAAELAPLMLTCLLTLACADFQLVEVPLVEVLVARILQTAAVNLRLEVEADFRGAECRLSLADLVQPAVAVSTHLMTGSICWMEDQNVWETQILSEANRLAGVPFPL